MRFLFSSDFPNQSHLPIGEKKKKKAKLYQKRAER